MNCPSDSRRDGSFLPLLPPLGLCSPHHRLCCPREKGSCFGGSRTRIPVAPSQEGGYRTQHPSFTPSLREHQTRNYPPRCRPGREFPPNWHPSANSRSLRRHSYRRHQRRNRQAEPGLCHSPPQRQRFVPFLIFLTSGSSPCPLGNIPNLKWSLSLSHTRLLKGGWIREQTVTDLPTCVFSSLPCI